MSNANCFYGTASAVDINPSQQDAATDTSGKSSDLPAHANCLLAALWRSPDKVHQLAVLDRVTGRFTSLPVRNVNDASGMATAFSAIAYDAYFACAEYSTPDNRTTANSSGAVGLWTDIDVGPDKAATGRGYPSIEDAQSALGDFCVKTGLPEPTHIVNSGAGLHAYWAFDGFLAREQWLEYAGKLKALMKACGLLADPSRTADIASVLRVPGTLNFKYSPPRPVTLLSSKAKLIELTVMLDAIDAAMVTFEVATVKVAPPAVAVPVAQAPVSGSMVPIRLQVDPDHEPPNFLTLASALKVLTPDCDERTWKFYRLGPLAYEARYFPELHDALYQLARDWSSGDLGGIPSVKWRTPGCNGLTGEQFFDHVWKRFLTDRFSKKRASLGTIYWHAKAEGWSFRSYQPEHADDAEVM